MPKLNEETPLVIIARTQVKEGKKEEYLKFGKEIDDAVNDTEPGMLFHDLGTDPNDPLALTWTEILKDSASFVFHLNNPNVVEGFKKQEELVEEIRLEIYGNVSDELINKVKELNLPFKYFKSTGVNYVRDFF